MKLYLSSKGLPDIKSFKKLFRKSSDFRMVMIGNAKDHYEKDVREGKILEYVNNFNAYGFKVDELDLRHYSSGDNLLFKKIKEYDAVWTIGGNTFCLRYAMEISGFSSIIQDLLHEGLIYAGDSAGSVVAGPDIEGVKYVDDPTKAKKKLSTGLSLINKVVIPHANNICYQPKLQAVYDFYEQTNTPVLKLRDGEAVIYENNTLRVIPSIDSKQISYNKA